MKAKQRTLPRGTPYDERAVALAKRLGVSIPSLPLTHAQWVTLWAEIGRKLLPFNQPEPATLKQLWAEIGMFLAEETEPEFRFGKGRRPGSKSRVPASDHPDTIRQRRSRANRDLKSM